VLALPLDPEGLTAPTVASGRLVVLGTSSALAGPVSAAAVRGCLGVVIAR